MSREKYEEIHVQKIKDQLDAELLKMLKCPVPPYSTEQPKIPMISFSIPVERKNARRA
jgi:hypothetical protein